MNKQPKSGYQNTPIRPTLSPVQSCNVTRRSKSRIPRDDSDVSGENSDLFNEVKDGSPLGSSTELRQFMEELRSVRAEIGLFRPAMSELTTAIKTQNLRLDTIENRLENLEATMGESDNSQIVGLEATIKQLKLEINERDQEMLGNDIEISGFPEASSENPVHVILTVAKTLSVHLDEHDV